MRSRPHKIAIVVLISFFVLVPVIALLLNPYYPVLVIAGESSVGTWMSGAMLVMAATLSLVLAIQKGWSPWVHMSMFFFLLALDERFMFHESIGERLLFAYPESAWLSQLPVMAAGLAGLWIILFLRRKFLPVNRIFLMLALAMGGVSVVYDLLEAGVLIEEILKLTAELCMVLALTGEIETLEEKKR